MENLLNIKEVSAMTRISIAGLRTMKQQGRGPKCGKLGRRIFYRETDVIAWVDAQFDKSA